jgi:hypothetical protein
MEHGSELSEEYDILGCSANISEEHITSIFMVEE